MKRHKIYQRLISALLLSGIFTLSSCDDFLTIYPTNSVVLENYWKEKADVEGMVATCYKTMLRQDFIRRAIVWGELRSDNTMIRTGADGVTSLRYVVEANLLPDNEYCNWAVFYEVINYCNMVLLYAPNVVNEDPDFTEGDLTVVEGQMYALRALCHFYLVRAFRDIPLALTANVDDSQVLHYPQVKPTVALDSIMVDLKRAERMVLGSAANVNTAYNKGYITRDAVRAVMADVLLWKAAFVQYEEGTDSTMASACIPLYDECIICCDSVIDAMNRYQKSLGLSGSGSTISGGEAAGDQNPYYLIQESRMAGTLTTSRSYLSIFGSKNSSESIFELQFASDNNPNHAISNLYGFSPTSGKLQAPAFLGQLGFESSPYLKNDYRRTAFLNLGTTSTSNNDEVKEVSIAKYTTMSGGTAGLYRSENNNDANWIVYRKTDVMLMKAEALAQRNGEGDLTDAFNLTKAVNLRSLSVASDSLTSEAYASAAEVRDLVLAERQRELMFEGKRWFDMVRKALREHSTTNILTLMVRKMENNAGAVQSKMASINTLFFPIYKGEMEVNPLLVQNEAYLTSSNIEKN